MKSRSRRLVNEYVRNEEGNYVLRMHDVEFVRYIHSKGFRCALFFSFPFADPFL